MGFTFGKVEVGHGAIKCANCDKAAEADTVANEDQCYHWTTLPPGWFAEIGLCDMSGLACSEACAKEMSK